MNSIPQAELGIIGGSTTWGARFPEDFPELGLYVLAHVEEQTPPFGTSAPLKLLEYKDRRILYVGMHGCFPNDGEVIHPYWASKQLAWIYKNAGVFAVLGGGSVGGIQTSKGERLPRWSVVIPDDFMMEPAVIVVPQGRTTWSIRESLFYRMALPFDPILSQVLYKQALAQNTDDQFPVVQIGGIYTCTPLGRFETKAEILRAKRDGGTVVGQTIGHETIELRNAQIPFAVINIVSNDAEGDNWVDDYPNGMAEFYWECPESMARVIASSAKRILDESIKPTSLTPLALTNLESFPVQGA